MTSFKNMLRVAAFGVAMVAAAAAPTKQAQAADRGDVIAGVVGGVLLGGFVAAVANAGNQPYVAPAQTYSAPAYVAPQQTYQEPVQTQTYTAPVQTQTYYAPAPTYYAPAPRYYTPPVSFSFGISSGHHYGHRRHFRRHYGHRHHRGYHRGHRHNHRGYRY